jgi:single-strand DNA-binding protein
MTILTGPFRIGVDAELRYLPDSGEAVISLSLAYSWGKRDADGKRKTQWVDATIWGKRAEALAPHLLKRTEVWCVIEDVHIETFERRDKPLGFKLAGRIQMLEFIGSRPEQQQDQRTAGPAPAPAAASRSTRAPAPSQQREPIDDEKVPF